MRSKIKTISLIINIILWVLLLPSLLFAFGSMFAADAFGTGLLTKSQESLITTAIVLCLLTPITILITAVTSLVLRLKKRFAVSLWIQFIPFTLIFAAIAYFYLASL